MIETKRQLAVASVSSEQRECPSKYGWTNPNPDPLALSEIGDRDFSDYSAGAGEKGKKGLLKILIVLSIDHIGPIIDALRP